jgi:spermidine synthase
VFLVEELPYFYLLAFENFHLMGHGLLAVQFGLAIALMILPTIGLGAMFPITIRGLNPSTTQTARLVGWSYALNTCGAIVGSVFAGFWLVPQWGSQKTMLAGITLNALCGAAAVLSVKTIGFARPRRICATLVFGFVVSLFFSSYQWPPYVLSSGIFRYVENYQGLGHNSFKEKMRENRGDILYFKEGLTCTVTVCRTATAVSLLVNGKPDASVPSSLTNPVNPSEKPQLKYGDLPTQISLGEIPMLLAAEQNRVMVIGLGSGVTLGSVLRHPVKRVECVELEDAVVKACRFFHNYNGYPLYDKRVDLVVNDARNHLLVTDKKYDVIISEPSNPWIAGAASLFTSEFFNLASSKLQPNGIFCQWIQLYELQADEFQAILRSFTAAFPSVHIFRVDMDAMLVGSTGANPIQLDRLQARLIPNVKADLERIDCRSAADLLANYWIGGQELRDFLKPGPRNTDDNMLIEFAAPLRMLSRSAKEQIAFVQQLAKLFYQHSTGLLPNVELGHLDNQAQADFWAKQSEASLRKQRVNEAILYADHSLKLSRTPLAVQVKGDALAQAGRPEEANAWWAAAEEEFPQEPSVLRALALIQQRENNYAAARLYAERWLAIAPEDARAKFLLGQICYQQKEWPAALLLLEPLVSVPTGDATPYELNYTLGSVYWRLGNYPQAIEKLKIVVEQVPNHIDARIRLADSLLRVGSEKEAFAEWQRVSYFRSGAAQALLQEARTAGQQNHGEQARAKFEQAFQFDPWNDDVNFHLARARKQSGDLNGAADLLEKYLAANPDRPWAVAYLAQICHQQKKTDRAVELAERYQAVTGLPWREQKD